MPQTTTGFLDALANYLGGLSLGLTKGTDLFAENMIEDPDRLTDQVVLYDEGNEQVPGFRHPHMNWNVRIATSRKVRLDAAEALRPITNELIARRRFTLTSDVGEDFQVIITRTISTPEVTERLDSGRFLASSVIQFEVIPFS